jgi:hypothetical protein
MFHKKRTYQYWQVLGSQEVQVLSVHKYNFIEKNINLTICLVLYFKQVIAFDWL